MPVKMTGVKYQAAPHKSYWRGHPKIVIEATSLGMSHLGKTNQMKINHELAWAIAVAKRTGCGCFIAPLVNFCPYTFRLLVYMF